MATPDLTIHVTDRQLSAVSSGIKLGEIRTVQPELEALCNRKIEAAEDFANAVKVASIKSGIDASVISSYITAVCKDTLKKKLKQTEQLSLLFES